MLPEELVARPQWVRWRWEMRDGKPTKPPYRADGRGRASSTDPTTWASYEVACRNIPKDGGIGYVFSQHDDLTGADLDHCRNPDSGRIDAWALEVVRELDSYTEVSPSGTGIHVVLRGRLPDGAHHKRAIPGAHPKAAIEIYDRGRYLTATGQRLPEASERVEERQEALERLLARLWSPNPAAKAPASGRGLAAREVIHRARRARNGAKFERLMAGDLQGYGSSSEADLALVSLLAFWTQDAGVILEVVRQSVLWDQKWERPDYQERTIGRALANCGETYSGASVHLQRAERTGTETDGNVLPMPAQSGARAVICNDRPLSEKTAEALDYLVQANDPPAIFSRDRELVRVGRTQPTPELPEMAVIETLSQAALREALDQAALFVVKEAKDRQTIISPPIDIVETIKARGEWGEIPALAGIVESPVVRPDGSLLTEPGFDPRTWLYHAPQRGFQLPAVSERPTGEEVAKAVALLDEGLSDFPFADEASRANAYALLLTPLLIHALPGDARIPVAVLDATSAGTGKGLLLDYTAIVATGHEAPKNGAPATDEELDKRLLSALLIGQSYFVLDNVAKVLEFPSLDRAVTSGTYQGRLLGVNRTVTGRLQWTWAITGNNVKVGGDLSRRCYWVRMESPVADPSERPPETFHHPDLIAWARENRARLAHAALTIVRSWYADGCPEADLPGVRVL
ncbi:MAG: hypothetical protein ACREQM_05685 [Candidatus Dormibacteraceae bacterium]